ncbi:hypothetical protein [Flavobacterium panacagri]|uniref:hypothetical protein n=1 Tax=Flavobacterium panacagri TaxID=3034146 RepID=UPI0025A4FE69|nr:hypothetical protein [Flavobacterium panacagri]
MINSKHKITIPKPCQENWNKMTPTESGRFCMSCSKTVVDFTLMLPEQIQHFFIQNQNEKICGRFRKSQLDAIIIQIPNRVLYTQTNYSKMFLLALFIAMGTTLFSCQNKEGKKQKIDTVEVVKDSDSKSHTSVEQASSYYDSLHPAVPPPSASKTDGHKSAKPTENDNLKSEKISGSESQKTTNKKNSSSKEQPIYVSGEVVYETNAEFPGGIDQFYTFFAKEFKRPEDSDATKTRLAFAVEKNGSVSFLECSPSVDQAIENEIIRVLKLCPKWQPGQSDGKKVKRQYSLPITLQ